MDFRQLRYFVAVANRGHFHKGAEDVRVSQPAVSRQIRLLEEDLGISLFERTSRGAVLTKAGTEFLVHAKSILSELDLAKMRTTQYAKGFVGEVRVGANEVAARHPLLSRSFGHLSKNNPEVKIKLMSMISHQQTAALMNHEIDAGFIYYRSNVEATFESIHVYREKFCLAIPEDHHLARKETISLKDLKEEPLIWPAWRVNPRLVTQLKEQFDKSGVTPFVIQEADHEHHVFCLVSASVGIGFVMKFVNEGRSYKNVVIRDADDFSVSTALEFTWMSQNRSTPLRHLISALNAVLQDQN